MSRIPVSHPLAAIQDRHSALTKGILSIDITGLEGTVAMRRVCPVLGLYWYLHHCDGGGDHGGCHPGHYSAVHGETVGEEGEVLAGAHSQSGSLLTVTHIASCV